MLGSGKYCGTRPPPALTTTSNYASVKYKGLKNIRGFTLQYREVTQECGGQITLTAFANSTVLQSPNHPEIPPPHSECAWTIFGTPGERLRIDFEFLDLTRTRDCKNEYVEIRDGGTDYSTLINRYCQDLPSSIFTTDNVAYLKFFTDVEDPKSGFKARVSLASCGGTMRAEKGVISVDASKDCRWHIIGPADHTIFIHFTKLDVPCHLGSVTISEFNQINGTEKTIATACGTTSDITSSSNEVFVNYHSSQAQTFRLTFNATQDGAYFYTSLPRKLINICC